MKITLHELRQIIASVIRESHRGRSGAKSRLPDQFGSNRQMRDAADDMHPEDFPLLDDPEEDIPAWGSFETSAREREVPGSDDRGGYHSKAFGTDAHLARALGRPQREVRIYEADDLTDEPEPPTLRMPRKSTGTGMSGRPAYVPPAAPPRKGKTRDIEQRYRGEQRRGDRFGARIDTDMSYDEMHPQHKDEPGSSFSRDARRSAEQRAAEIRAEERKTGKKGPKIPPLDD